MTDETKRLLAHIDNEYRRYAHPVKWMDTLIKSLIRRVTDLESVIDAQAGYAVEGGRRITLTRGLGTHVLAVDDRCDVEFADGKRSCDGIRVSLMEQGKPDGFWLRISGGERIVIKPTASNSCLIGRDA